MEKLPRDLLVYLTTFLSYSSLWNFLRLNKKCSTVIDENFWKNRLILDFSFTEIGNFSKDQYKAKYYLLRADLLYAKSRALSKGTQEMKKGFFYKKMRKEQNEFRKKAELYRKYGLSRCPIERKFSILILTEKQIELIENLEGNHLDDLRKMFQKMVILVPEMEEEELIFIYSKNSEIPIYIFYIWYYLGIIYFDYKEGLLPDILLRNFGLNFQDYTIDQHKKINREIKESYKIPFEIEK